MQTVQNLGKIGSMKIFAASANQKLANAIVKQLNIPLGLSEATRFPDGEISMRVNETVRGSDVFIVQSTSTPVNDHLMELLIMIDAMRRSSAARITAVVPYFGYARQDRRTRSHDPISAKLVADLITQAGADRILSMDLHCPQIQGFFNIPMDHLRGIYNFADYLKHNFGDLSELVVVSPDFGSVTRSSNFAKMLGVPLAIMDKTRLSSTETEITHFIGDVEGKTAVLVDDVLSTGGTLCNAAKTALKKGAKKVFACVTHAVLAEGAMDNLNDSLLEKIMLLDTIEIPKEKMHPKIEVISIAPIVAKAISCIHLGQSIGKLYQGDMYRTDQMMLDE
ncbi:MAG: ribose-phosphate pyrophosphokinase [Defluviitaleaceae bacterium]|nr:ribose-phosphate pyrophosphokinase [Defluviitaleaceae bacterium]